MTLDPDDFTESAWQAIIDAKDLALDKNHQILETEHLFSSLIKKNEIAIKTIERSGGSIKNLRKGIEEFITNQPKMQKTQDSIFLMHVVLLVCNIPCCNSFVSLPQPTSSIH